MVNDAMARAGILDVTGKPLNLTAHDFRRFFATEAVSSGLPIHIAARLLGHHSLTTTQSYLAIFQDDLVRSYRAFLEQRRAMRPEAEYREPTSEEWQEFQQLRAPQARARGLRTPLRHPLQTRARPVN
jgi:hypothetical protein